jgi:copper chaperone CopZ
MDRAEIRFPIADLVRARARALERALRGVGGVVSARVNPASALATVAYDPARVALDALDALDALGDAIRRTGCGVARRDRAPPRFRVAVERRPAGPE